MHATGTYHSHAFAHHEHKCLLIDRAWVCEEEIAEREMEEGHGGDDCLGGYERHGCGSASIRPEGLLLFVVVGVYAAYRNWNNS